MVRELLERGLAGTITRSTLAADLAGQCPNVRTSELASLAETVEPFLTSLPGAIDALCVMSKTPPAGRSAAFAAGQVLLYLFDNDDLAPEADFGVVGLLDDAYLIHSCVAALKAASPQLRAVASLSYTPPDDQAIAIVRELLPAGIADALDSTCRNLVGLSLSLFATTGIDRGDAERLALTFRVEEAARRLAGDPVRMHMGSPRS